MPDEAAPLTLTPEDVEDIEIRAGDGLLADIWTLHRQELERMPVAWRDMTEDEKEAMRERHFSLFSRIEQTRNEQATKAAIRRLIANDAPMIRGTLKSLQTKGESARGVFDFPVTSLLHELMDAVGSRVTVVLGIDATEPDEPKSHVVDDKTRDLFDEDGKPRARFEGTPPDPEPDAAAGSGDTPGPTDDDNGVGGPD